MSKFHGNRSIRRWDISTGRRKCVGMNASMFQGYLKQKYATCKRTENLIRAWPWTLTGSEAYPGNEVIICLSLSLCQEPLWALVYAFLVVQQTYRNSDKYNYYTFNQEPAPDSTHYLFSDWPKAYSELSKSTPGTSSSCRSREGDSAY